MAFLIPTSTKLNLLEYERLYSNERGWEYWFGEARRKPVPTILHGVLQLLLGHLLFLAGYGSSSETELRSDPEWHPRPDVAGILGAQNERYPTRPIDVAFEILSEGEEILEKCQQYTRIGVPQVFVFHPEGREIQRWDGGKLVAVQDVELANGATITGQTIWRELDARLTCRAVATIL